MPVMSFRGGGRRLNISLVLMRPVVTGMPVMSLEGLGKSMEMSTTGNP